MKRTLCTRDTWEIGDGVSVGDGPSCKRSRARGEAAKVTRERMKMTLASKISKTLAMHHKRSHRLDRDVSEQS